MGRLTSLGRRNVIVAGADLRPSASIVRMAIGDIGFGGNGNVAKVDRLRFAGLDKGDVPAGQGLVVDEDFVGESGLAGPCKTIAGRRESIGSDMDNFVGGWGRGIGLGIGECQQQIRLLAGLFAGEDGGIAGVVGGPFVQAQAVRGAEDVGLDQGRDRWSSDTRRPRAARAIGTGAKSCCRRPRTETANRARPSRRG